MCRIALEQTLQSAAPATPVRGKRSLAKSLSDEKQNKQDVVHIVEDSEAVCKQPVAKRARADAHVDPAALPECAEQQVACSSSASSTSSSSAVDSETQEEETQCTPYPLVARERECKVLDQFLGVCLGEKQRLERGGSLYVSGGPGTGKTCSVLAAAKAWKRAHVKTEIVMVNCMDLAQRSVTGLLKHIATGTLGGLTSSPARVPDSTTKCSGAGPGLLAAAAKRLKRFGPSVILVVDEVDQLVGRTCAQTAGMSTLDTLFELPRHGASPALAIISIANAVDLLERGAVNMPLDVCKGNCKSLLFQPYDADQLRKIVRSRFESAGAKGVAAEKAFGKVNVELRVRQVAKRSGDCRPIVQLCEQAVFEAARVEEANLQTDACQPPTRSLVRPDLAHNDPLKAVQQLPIEQQVLLCALAAGTGEAMSVSEVSTRYKDMCKQLHQPQNLASKDQVSDALSSLEQRGLLSLRAAKRKGPAGGKRLAAATAMTAELAVSRSAVRDSVARANPLLKRCLE